MADKPLCKIEGCGKSAWSRGWCGKHYQRWRNHGDPIAIKSRPIGRDVRPAIVTADYVRSRLNYDPVTGIFTWLARPVVRQYDKTWNAKHAGKEAGRRDAKGYLVIGIDYRGYRAHRLAWLYVHGEWPAVDVDHRDQDKTNARIANLRPATKKQNRWNEGLRRNNTSGFKGVYLNKALNKWQAYITIDRRAKYLGIFENIEEAALARDRAARALRGEFASLNFTKEHGLG